MELPTKGLLSEVSFIEILKDGSASTVTGMIRLETGPVIKVVYLQNGTIAFASSNEKSDRLTEVLKRAGKLTPEQIEHAQARIKPNVSLGKTLVELGYISPKDLLWGARMQVEGILYQLLFWEHGSYQVLEGPLPKEIVSLGLTIPQIIYNGIMQTRDRDWILQHIGSPEAIFAAAPGFDEKNAEYDLPVDDVVSKMDGTRSLEEIAQATEIDTFEVCKMVAALQILELARPQPFKPTQMPLSVSEKDESEPVTDETPETPGDISLGQVMQIPTVEELREEPQQPVGEESYSAPIEEDEDLEEVTAEVEEEPVEPPPPEESPFREVRGTLLADEEDETLDSEYEELIDEGGGWNKAVLFIAILGVVAAAISFYYVRKSSEGPKAPVTTILPEKRKVSAVPNSRKPVLVVPKPSETATPKNTSSSQIPSGTQTPIEAASKNQPLKMALSGNVSEAAQLWKRELSKNRNRLTIQLEIACQDSTVMEALNLFGKTAPLYVVPLNFRGQPCYRVLYGIYNNEAQARAKLGDMPSEFLQQPSPPKVIPISKVLQ